MSPEEWKRFRDKLRLNSEYRALGSNYSRFFDPDLVKSISEDARVLTDSLRSSILGPSNRENLDGPSPQADHSDP